MNFRIIVVTVEKEQHYFACGLTRKNEANEATESPVV